MNMKSILPFLFVLTLATPNQAQNTEVDFSSSALLTRLNFHYGGQIKTDSDESYDNTGSNFAIGLTSSIGKHWYLRTELGYVSNNSFILASYSFDEGFGRGSARIASYLNNEKIYLGVFPEYRKHIYESTLSIHGGPFLARDISNTFTSANEILLPKSRLLGLRLNGSLIIGQKKIRVKLNVGHTWFGKSRLFNRHHPYVSYNSFNFGLGLIYVMGKI